MRNEDFYAKPAPPPPPDPPYPVGASAQWSSYSPDEQLALATARLTSERNMGRRYRLGFFARVGRGFTLARTTGGVVRDVPSLLVPALLALVLDALVLAVAVPALGGPEALSTDSDTVLALKLAPLGALLTVISVLAQAVVVDASTERMQLGSPNVTRSWGKALAHLPDLVFFAVLCTAFALVTGALSRNRVGEWVAGLLDRAWEFATFFAVPVVLYENAGPLQAVKRSAVLARRHWGEQLAGRGALRLALTVLALPLLAAAVLIGWSLGPVVLVALVVGVVLLLVVLSATLQGVLSAALYRFAVTGEVAPGFTRFDLDLPFRA